MNINIEIRTNENNDLEFFIDVPLDVLDKNPDLYDVIYSDPFYIEKNSVINIENLQKNLNKFIKNYFSGTNIKVNDTYNILVDDIYTIIKIIKSNNNLKFHTVLFDTQYEEIVSSISKEKGKNLSINFENSNSNLKYSEFIDMYNELDKIVNFIKKYNLSPIEQVLLTYDIIKANRYNEESNNENHNISRDLDKIINGDKIVCVGYSNLINFILNRLGFINRKIWLQYKNSKEGHVRNLICIDDKKYNIKGNFILDCTWDSKKNDDYLDNYMYFLRPLSFFSNNKNEIVFNPEFLELLKLDDSKLKEVIKNFSNDKKMKLFLSFNSFSSIKITDKDKYHILSNIAQNKNFDNELIKLALSIKCELNKKINEENFKNALYKVRRIEYINGIINEDISEEKINKICSKYYKETNEIKLLKALDMYEEPNFNKDLEEIKAKSIEQDSLRMRFLKDIKTRIGDLPDDKFIKKM